MESIILLRKVVYVVGPSASIESHPVAATTAAVAVNGRKIQPKRKEILIVDVRANVYQQCIKKMKKSNK